MRRYLAAGGIALVFAVSFVLVLSGPIPAHSEDLAELGLKNVTWQGLPAEVCTVFVGPDDRVWCEMHPTRKMDLDQLKELIRLEFPKAGPQLMNARPALFEPGGRVWFRSRTGKELIGFDGDQMVDRIAEVDHRFPGNCPGHGRFQRKSYNLFLENTAFLVESHGVLMFSNGKWEYEQMTKTTIPSRGASYPHLYVEPDGKGITAMLCGRDWSSLWRWRDGKWKEVELPEEIKTKVLTGVAPWKDGVWLFMREGVAFLSYVTDIDKEFESLLGELGAEEFRTRKAATEKIISLGMSVLGIAREANEQASDPEVRERLAEVLAAVTPDTGCRVKLGDYTLARAELVHYDLEATVYMTSTNIVSGGESLGPGVAIGTRDGSVRAVLGKAPAARWTSTFWKNSGPLVEESGRKVWLPERRSAGDPGLLDLGSGELTKRIPDKSAGWLHAITQDGVIYVGRGEPMGHMRNPIMRFDPNAVDDRLFLKTKTVEITGDKKFWVAPDGIVWAEVLNKGILRFDGTGWAKIKGLNMTEARDLIPGENGSAIAVGREGCFLVIGDEAKVYPSMQALVSDGAEDIRKDFDGSFYTRWLSVVPDGKNIWLREFRKLTVMVDGEWMSTTNALRVSGSSDGQVEYSARCADGLIYVSDFDMAAKKGSSHFGEIQDGQVKFTRAPHTCETWTTGLGVKDNAGCFWIPGSDRVASGGNDRVRAQLAIRMKGKEMVQQLEKSGWAVLSDMSDNVWLSSDHWRFDGHFNIWRDGKIVHSVKVPGALTKTHAVSDRPGSVFMWTKLGLQHLCENPDKPGVYTFGHVYGLRDFAEMSPKVAYSKLGFFVIAGSTGTERKKCLLHFAKLP